MRKAFDTINIHTLIRQLLQTNIPGIIMKFIANYIKGHTTYRNHTSIQHQFKTGIPQGDAICNNVRAQQTLPKTPTLHYNRHKDKHAPYVRTSLVSRHLATRGNNKIHISRSSKILPRLTQSNSEHINHPFSNHIYTKLTPNHIHHQYVPFI